jgi:hypothetical protein
MLTAAAGVTRRWEATMEGRLIDLDNYPRIEATGTADCYMLAGGRVRFVMFDWFKIEGLWQRVVTGMVTRGIVGMREEQYRFWQETSLTSGPADMLMM